MFGNLSGGRQVRSTRIPVQQGIEEGEEGSRPPPAEVRRSVLVSLKPGEAKWQLQPSDMEAFRDTVAHSQPAIGVNPDTGEQAYLVPVPSPRPLGDTDNVMIEEVRLTSVDNPNTTASVILRLHNGDKVLAGGAHATGGSTCHYLMAPSEKFSVDWGSAPSIFKAPQVGTCVSPISKFPDIKPASSDRELGVEVRQPKWWLIRNESILHAVLLGMIDRDQMDVDRLQQDLTDDVLSWKATDVSKAQEALSLIKSDLERFYPLTSLTSFGVSLVPVKRHGEGGGAGGQTVHLRLEIRYRFRELCGPNGLPLSSTEGGGSSYREATDVNPPAPPTHRGGGAYGF